MENKLSIERLELDSISYYRDYLINNFSKKEIDLLLKYTCNSNNFGLFMFLNWMDMDILEIPLEDMPLYINNSNFFKKERS